MILFNPRQFKSQSQDPRAGQIVGKTIEFFESRGKAKLKHDDHERVWYSDFIEFQKKERIFSTLMTPKKYAQGNADAHWDTWRNCEFNEVLGFYGLAYWYTWQVSMLGLGPIWMGDNEEIKTKTAKLLEEGAIFAFGLSEKEHGADLYSSEMRLIKAPGETYEAVGRKYYIGNGNKAALVSTFGKLEDGQYVFFAVNSQHPKYECVKNVVNSQNFVAEYALNRYPIKDSDILSRGDAAWDSSLNTINVCKFNLGWASIGICTHAFYEAIAHASGRRLFDHQVTDFPHVRQLFVDAYSRLVAMKLFASRASDYMRSASPTDRRYLLFNPMVKMKVTTQGEEVINHLWDVIAAKGFEKDMVFDAAARDIRALPKLEGTVHVNMALIVKFMQNYFFHPEEFPEIPLRRDSKEDEFLMHQGPTKGLRKIRFHDYRIAYDLMDTPNLAVFKKQIRAFKTLLMLGRPTKEQTKDIDFLLILGELFTLVAYGQLILEGANLQKLDSSLVDQIFDFMVRDFSKFALQLYSKPSATMVQQTLCKFMIHRAVPNSARFDAIWREQVFALKEAYAMNR